MDKIYYKIEKIKKTPQGYVLYISSSLGSSFEMPISPDQYDRFDLDQGEIIDDEHFLKIREEHLFDNARRHAFSILSYGENNKKMLVMKLQKQGFSRELCENVAIYMEHRGYIDEKKQSNPRIRDKPLTLLIFDNIFSAINLKTPSLLKPAITVIRQKSKPNVRKSIYSKYL